MSTVDCSLELLYAQKYSTLPVTSPTRSLIYRDVPGLLRDYTDGKYILDYGCGSGHYARLLKSLGFCVDAVDINKYMINIAREADQTGNYSVIKSGEVLCKDGQYDCVFSCFVLVHVGSKEELLRIMKELARVLKPNGTLILIVNSEHLYNYHNEWLSFDVKFEANKKAKSGSAIKIRFKDSNLILRAYSWSYDDYCDVLEKAGLRLICTHNPLGKESDGVHWGIELEKSPCTIFIAKKYT